MATNYSCFVSCLMFWLIFTIVYGERISNKRMRIIHSPRPSPNYNLNNNLNANVSFSGSTDIHINAKSSLFLVEIHMGKPEITQLLLMDTGSHVTWVQCNNTCQGCYVTPNPRYDPQISSTYVEIECSSFDCQFVLEGECSSSRDYGNGCFYNVSYGNGVWIGGVYANENMLFKDNDEEVTMQIVFGCATRCKNLNKDKQIDGILGLNGHQTSILRSSAMRNSPKFSYCLGNISDPDYRYSKLILGHSSLLLGFPISIKLSTNGLYLLTIQGIKIGEDEYIAENPKNYVLDTGTSFSRFEPSLYDIVSTTLKRVLDSFDTVERGGFFCFLGNFHMHAKPLIPTVELHIAGGSNNSMKLKPESLFFTESGQFCFAFLRSQNLRIIGAFAQQFYNVGLDLAAEELYLQDIDCEFIPDDES